MNKHILVAKFFVFKNGNIFSHNTDGKNEPSRGSYLETAIHR